MDDTIYYFYVYRRLNTPDIADALDDIHQLLRLGLKKDIFYTLDSAHYIGWFNAGCGDKISVFAIAFTDNGSYLAHCDEFTKSYDTPFRLVQSISLNDFRFPEPWTREKMQQMYPSADIYTLEEFEDLVNDNVLTPLDGVGYLHDGYETTKGTPIDWNGTISDAYHYVLWYNK